MPQSLHDPREPASRFRSISLSFSSLEVQHDCSAHRRGEILIMMDSSPLSGGSKIPRPALRGSGHKQATVLTFTSSFVVEHMLPMARIHETKNRVDYLRSSRVQFDYVTYGYAALLAHAEGVLYGMELGKVTIKINNQHTPTRESEFRNVLDRDGKCA